MQFYKNKITNVVKEYRRLFKDEYDAFTKENKLRQNKQLNDFATLQQESMLEQLLTEVPVTLDSMLKTQLPEDGWKWYISKTGSRWFAKNFPEFSVAQKI